MSIKNKKLHISVTKPLNMETTKAGRHGWPKKEGNIKASQIGSSSNSLELVQIVFLAAKGLSCLARYLV
jgi:hypothetical protein